MKDAPVAAHSVPSMTRRIPEFAGQNNPGFVFTIRAFYRAGMIPPSALRQQLRF
jgi:hypothetical protein